MAVLCFPRGGIAHEENEASAWFATRTRGVFSAENNFEVAPIGGMRIELSKGIGWILVEEFVGKVFANTDPIQFDIAMADGLLDRIDRLVFRYDKIPWPHDPSFIIKQGEFSSNPVAPPLVNNANMSEIGLWDIKVPAGTTSLNITNLIDQRLNENLCGLMRDGVTRIPTQTLYDQVQAILNALAEDIKIMLKSASTDIEEFKDQSRADFDIWFNELQELLDENTATNLLNMIVTTNARVDSVISYIGRTPATLFTANWISDTSIPEYPWKYTLLNNAITGIEPPNISWADRAARNVMIEIFDNAPETIPGGLVIRAKEQPSINVNIRYGIDKVVG